MDLMKMNLPKKYLLFLDLFCIFISFIMASWLRYGNITHLLLHKQSYRIAIIFILSCYILIHYLYNTYKGFFKRGFLEEMVAVTKVNIALAASITVMLYLFQEGNTYSRLLFICFIVLNILITFMFRQYFKLLLLAVYKKSSSSNKVMIITDSSQVMNVLSRVRSENNWDYQVTYLTILDQNMVGQRIAGVEVKANSSNMFEVAKLEVIDEVFIHISNDYAKSPKLEDIVTQFQIMGVTVDVSINTFGLKIREKIVREVSGYHVLTFSSTLFNESQLIIKRILDLIGGLIGCIFTLILTVFIAPAIRLETPGPIFFSQIRIGKNGRRFKIYKFRSMYLDAEKRQQELMESNEMKGHMFKLKNDPRITKVGNFLRKTSLDEFPQFFNVLRGDMSLVGTRPPTVSEFIHYESRHKRRLQLKSGVTGLWQVSGRSDISDFEEVVRLDLEYIDNWSLLSDLKILLKTIYVVLFGRGAK